MGIARATLSRFTPPALLVALGMWLGVVFSRRRFQVESGYVDLVTSQ